MSISITRFAKRTAAIAIGILAARYVYKKKMKSNADYTEYTYSSMFGEAEVFTLESESGEPVRVLNVGGGFQSATYLGAKRFEPVFEYYRAFDHMFDCENYVSTVLMLGGGGFSYPKHLLTSRKDVAIDVVEMDPVIVEIARNHFFVDELEERYGDNGDGRMHIWTVDGVTYLSTMHDKIYDVIINDAFDGANPVAGLLTRLSLERAKDCLSQGGLYMLNAVIAEGDEEILHTYMEILLEGFENIYAIRCNDEEFAGEDNWLLIASDAQHYFEGIDAMISR